MKKTKILINPDPTAAKRFTARIKAMYDGMLANQIAKWKDYEDKKAAYEKEWNDYNNLPWHQRWNTHKPIIHFPFKPDDWDSYGMVEFRQLYFALMDPDVSVKEIDQEMLISLLRYEKTL